MSLGCIFHFRVLMRTLWLQSQCVSRQFCQDVEDFHLQNGANDHCNWQCSQVSVSLSPKCWFLSSTLTRSSCLAQSTQPSSAVRGGGGFLVLWIYQSKFGFIHEPWKKFPAWVSMMTPWHHSTCWLLVYMLMILMFFFNCNEKPKVQYLNVAKTNLVYCEQHASIFQYVLPAFNAVWVTGVFLLRLMFLCEDTFDVAHLHRLVPEQHMQKHCSCPLHVMFLF